MKIRQLNKDAVKSRDAVRKVTVLSEEELQSVAGGAAAAEDCKFQVVDENGNPIGTGTHRGYPNHASQSAEMA